MDNLWDVVLLDKACMTLMTLCFWWRNKALRSRKGVKFGITIKSSDKISIVKMDMRGTERRVMKDYESLYRTKWITIKLYVREGVEACPNNIKK